MSKAHKISCRDLPPCVKQLTRKRECWVEVRGGPVQTHGTWWDGGSRNEYYAVDLATGFVRRPPVPTNPFAGVYEAQVEPVDAEVVVQGGTFCGKDATIKVYVPPHLAADFAGVPVRQFLKAAGVEFQTDTPLGIILDYLDDHGGDQLAARVRSFYGLTSNAELMTA